MRQDLISRFESAKLSIKGLQMNKAEEIQLAYILRDIDIVFNDPFPNEGALEHLITHLEDFTVELPKTIGEQYV